MRGAQGEMPEPPGPSFDTTSRFDTKGDPMPYDSLTGRTEADVLIPPESATEIIKLVAEESAALQLMRSVRMSSKVFSQPVLSAFAQAYWVGGDTGLKQTSELAWADAELTAEEIAAIVPVPDAVIDDSGFPIWAEVREALAEAVAIKLDQAVLAGTDKPASWPEAIIPAAIAAGNTNVADSTAADGGIANDISETFDDVEDDGYDVTGIAAVRSLRARLRRARDTSGQKLLDVSTSEVLEAPVVYVANGVIPDTALAVAGQWDLACLGVRQDMRFKLLDQAVISNDAGVVILNLAQQDTQALRVTARFAYAVATPASRPVTGAGTPFPFSVLTPGVAAAAARTGAGKKA
jgi:HK97 family phage major capsid protein